MCRGLTVCLPVMSDQLILISADNRSELATHGDAAFSLVLQQTTFTPPAIYFTLPPPFFF